jgi:hypothetical protein
MQINSLISVKQMFLLITAALTLLTQMKYTFNILFLIIFFLVFSASAQAQCAVCTKTALQLGEKPAQGLNAAILYLMMAPFAIVGFIGYRWWKGNKKYEEEQ